MRLRTGWLMVFGLLVGTLLLGSGFSRGADEVSPLRTLDAGRHLLGMPGPREWIFFDKEHFEGPSLEIKFAAKRNVRPGTLLIRQQDVKLNWPVKVNDHLLGKLDLLEGDEVSVFTVPAETLRDGENTLTIVSPRGPDDIVISEIKLDSRPPEEALREASVAVEVKQDTDGAPLPCRITIVDARGFLTPVFPESGQKLAVRSGVVYTGDGRARFGLPAGDYVIYATRGVEYGLATQKLSLKPGDHPQVALKLAREVPTPNMVACDTHIHTLTYSKHGDATVDERALTLAGECVEVAIATEHNFFGGYAEAAQRMDVAPYFTCVVGDEVTTLTGHFNVFPIKDVNAPVPDFKLKDWPALMMAIRAGADDRVVVLNHPCDNHNNFVPFDAANFNPVTGDNLRGGADFSFDAMEVVNSGAMRSDFMQPYRAWFALLNHGYHVTAVGASDCHDVSRFIVGQGRTYVECDGRNAGQICVADVCQNIKEGRASVSLGLIAKLTVDGRFEAGDLATVRGPNMRVRVQVLGPTWSKADKVELYANGVKIADQEIHAAANAVEKASAEWLIPRPSHDVYLVAIASGPGITAPYWKQAPPYQPDSRELNLRVIASTNPVWVDADDDGKFTSARGYAKLVLDRVGMDPTKLVTALAGYDEAVAAQAAGLCQVAGHDVRDDAFKNAMSTAAEPVKRGFAVYEATLPPK
jgi:hypothetical protein